MKISTKGRYALRMLLDLAVNGKEGYTALRDVAERQNISKKYLEQIVPVLHKADILVTTRGFQGGYKLAREPKDIKVGEVLRLTEGNLAPVVCLETEKNTCKRAPECVTLHIWKGLQKVIADYLDSITLQDMVDKSQTGTSEKII
ncbi:MAG: Rrf2 family transcriptional regulator [Clostridia bacterium]|nr:Rrf2 family transcriptional regulator [Clostridia bacterium]